MKIEDEIFLGDEIGVAISRVDTFVKSLNVPTAKSRFLIKVTVLLSSPE
jgi:hypothetical protein